MSERARRLIGRAYAFYFGLRTVGRVRGTNFIMRKPSLVRVARGATVSIGPGVVIEKGARIVARADMRIESGTYIGKNSTLIAYAPLIIAAGSLLGENVSLHTEDHGPPHDRDAFRTAPIRIGSRVWLAAGVVVLKGVTIGADATVGANAVVTRDVARGDTVVGVPARSVRNETAHRNPPLGR